MSDTTKRNKAVARRIPEEIFNQHKLDVIDEIIAPEFRSHVAPDAPPGPESFRRMAEQWLSAFPDTKFTVEQEIAERDLVVERVTCEATMTGEFAGMPPTGKHARWTETHISRVKDGKLVEHWANSDKLEMSKQIGTLEAMAA